MRPPAALNLRNSNVLIRAARRSLGPRGWFAGALVFLGLGAVWWWVPPPNQHLFGGYPQAQNWPNRLSVHVLANPGFTVAYSEWHGGPAWVAYRARRIAEHGGVGRLDHFSLDHRTLRRISSDDYRHSGFDRGHLAPNYAMAKMFGPAAQRASFRMSNITPQAPRLNQLLWQRLEEAETDLLAPADNDLWVLTGPIYAERPERLASAVSVPHAFFRVWVKQDAQGPRVLALRVPQTVCGDEDPADFLVSIDALEAEIGWDLMPALAPEQQAQLEATVRTDAWPLAQLATRKARFGERFARQPCP